MPSHSALALSGWVVLGVGAASLGVCYAGQSAYELLETAYAIGMVGLFVPLARGLYGRRGGPNAALAAMLTGTAVWAVHLGLGWDSFGGRLLAPLEVPQALAATLLAWLAYEATAGFEPRRAPA